MINKTFIETDGKKVARVTFTVPGKAKSERVFLVGDFNDWNPKSHPLHYDSGGQLTLTLDLEFRRAYQFRYLGDGGKWMYDSHADAYVYNPHGSYSFIVVTDPDFKRHDAA